MQNDAEKKDNSASVPKEKARQDLLNTGEQDLLNTGEQDLLNTGPDAVIGYDVQTGQPLTKRQLFGEENQPGQASQHIHSGPELTGEAPQKSKPVTVLEDLQSRGPQADDPINPGTGDQYETDEETRKGWHSGKESRREKD